MIYDITTLSLLPNTLGVVMPLLPATYAGFSTTGRVLGAFNCDFGHLNRFAFLSGYESVSALSAERARRMEDADPYGIGQYLAEVKSIACKPLNFTTPIEPGKYGPFYEIRSYTMLPGGMPKTEAAWAKAVPAREKLSKILMVMGSIDTVPQKLIHIWTYPSMEARTEARAETYRQKIWPPVGGSDFNIALQSELFLALPFSDLQ